jgi:hypothetical protein
VLKDDEIVAAIDLKADGVADTMQIRQWTWVGNGGDRTHREPIEAALARFEKLQLNRIPLEDARQARQRLHPGEVVSSPRFGGAAHCSDRPQHIYFNATLPIAKCVSHGINDIGVRRGPKFAPEA